jgi:hypothetical protein
MLFLPPSWSGLSISAAIVIATTEREGIATERLNSIFLPLKGITMNEAHTENNKVEGDGFIQARQEGWSMGRAFANLSHSKNQGCSYQGGFMRPAERLLAGVKMYCVVCGKSDCDCWEVCSCGWSNNRGIFCSNPNTKSCSMKMKYGLYDRKQKRWVIDPNCMLRDLRPQEINLVNKRLRNLVRGAWRSGKSVPFTVTLVKQTGALSNEDIAFATDQIDAINPTSAANDSKP